MERRVLLAVTLSFLVLLVYQTLFVKPTPKPQPQADPAAAASPGATAPRQLSKPETAEAAPDAEPVEDMAAVVVGDTVERDVVVESEFLKAVFTTRGAELKSWQLKRFSGSGGGAMDVIPAEDVGDRPGAFAVRTDDARLDERLHEALFRPSATEVAFGEDGTEVVFEFQDEAGLRARKVFRFVGGREPYVVRVSAAVSEGGRDVPVALDSGAGIGETERATGQGGFFSPNYYQPPEAILHRDGKVTRIAAASLGEQGVQNGALRYAGMDDHYFISVVLPGERRLKTTYEAIEVPGPAAPKRLVAYQASVDGPIEDLAYYIGPKEFDVLAASDRELVRVINFGIFSWMVVPLLRALNWINGFLGNYGWSIIALTILINAVMFPLRHKSVVSMRKMQELQPEVKSLQDRYAKLKMTDPGRQKMNVELMNLYRERGVNPASGCVPMLLTFPVLFAFYSLLSQAIELRGAPFVGWIHDLARYDPLFITPLLMGATMVWQQRLTPTSADPTQQKVMMFMPIMFTFMFLWAPSGLVLYWLVSNVWAIGQQYLTNHLIGPPRAQAAHPAAEPRAKKG
jgi:YidC/Oxa1 family membrane protein insertase